MYLDLYFTFILYNKLYNIIINNIKSNLTKSFMTRINNNLLHNIKIKKLKNIRKFLK